MIQFIVSSTLLFFTPNLVADSVIENGGSSNKPMQYGDGASGMGTTGGANTAMLSQMLSAGTSAAMGVSLRPNCAPGPSHNGALCAMSYLSFGQAGASLLAAVESGKTKSAAYGGGWDANSALGAWDPNSLVDGEYIPNSTGGLNTYINESLDEFPPGYNFDSTANKLTTPFGEFEASEATPEALAAAAGQGSSGIKLTSSTAVKLGNEITKKMKTKGTRPSISGVQYGNGGGGASSYTPTKYTPTDYSALIKRMGRNPASHNMIAGKSRKLAAGESIGVKVDNLFEMIHRRYQKKRKANVFIEPIINKK